MSKQEYEEEKSAMSEKLMAALAEGKHNEISLTKKAEEAVLKVESL
jgi:hypothetical protein